jgi:hypothetical protein
VPLEYNFAAVAKRIKNQLFIRSSCKLDVLYHQTMEAHNDLPLSTSLDFEALLNHFDTDYSPTTTHQPGAPSTPRPYTHVPPVPLGQNAGNVTFPYAVETQGPETLQQPPSYGSNFTRPTPTIAKEQSVFGTGRFLYKTCWATLILILNNLHY